MILKSKTSTYLVKSHSLFTFIENEQRENNLSKFKLKICTKKKIIKEHDGSLNPKMLSDDLMFLKSYFGLAFSTMKNYFLSRL